MRRRFSPLKTFSTVFNYDGSRLLPRVNSNFGGLSMGLPMLRDDCRPYRCLRTIDRRLMQHREEPSLRASLDRRGPGIGAGCGRMAGQVEDVHHAYPYGLTFKGLADGDRLRKPRGTAMHLFDRRL